MIKEFKCYTLLCDNCGADVNEDSEVSGWDSEEYNYDIRDIPQLTDEEKIYINDNLFYGLFKNTVSLNANAIWNSFDELLAVCEDKTALIDYLRGNNILIEPEDWFKSGKAVKDDK